MYVLIKCISMAKFSENCCISSSIDNILALNIFFILHVVENHLALEVALLCGSWFLIDRFKMGGIFRIWHRLPLLEQNKQRSGIMVEQSWYKIVLPQF